MNDKNLVTPNVPKLKKELENWFAANLPEAHVLSLSIDCKHSLAYYKGSFKIGDKLFWFGFCATNFVPSKKAKRTAGK